ncbi:MAG: glycoside hydrolase family 3 protein [Alphaproteobacteria bacterium]|nr:glycoside hydrolase family 3 protein [Alphaproteobacteria bacterium]
MRHDSRLRRMKRLALLAALPTALLAFAASSRAEGPAVGPVHWPKVRSRVAHDPAVEARVEAMLRRMSIEQKVAQIVQGDIASIKPEDMARTHFGSILAGGNSAPGGVETAPPADWLKLADAFWDASMSGPEGSLKIPSIFGIDAVHGHANIVGATIFPQNIGLGAMRDPALIRRIGEVTAREMAVTGFDWDFSPTLAVVRDDRWGRTYEGFSEDPEVVRSYAGPMIEGLQGMPGTREFVGPGHVIATAKHFVGDGGTAGGKDQGDNLSTPEQLRDIHGAGYPPAIEAGVQAVMASFSLVRGEKVHGDRALLTGALKEDMGFDGLVVGDWNAHGQVPGCTNMSCPASIIAGLDMFMAPDSWKGLYENTLAQAKSGEIPTARLDDAVRRILRVKVRAGLFEKGRPSSRPFAGRFELLGAPEHRAVARQAVRESLVLLKNAGHVLPLSPRLNLLVAGDGADNISKQAGGWTITWQGTGIGNEYFPHAQSIFSGIKETVAAAGGNATLSVEGAYSTKPDAAIVIFGENPYAEFVGDRSTLEYSPADKKDLDLLRRFKAAGIPTVSVFLSGRPLWVNPEINASDAFVAAFLPGSEGGGVADLLFGNPDRSVRNDFRGKLSYSWPKRADQYALNRGDADYDPLFAFGHGLTYADKGDLPFLSEDKPAGPATAQGVLFGRGGLAEGAGWSSSHGLVAVRAIDRRAQEDARTFTVKPHGAFGIFASPTLDLSREATGQLSLIFEYRVDAPPTAAVDLQMNTGSVPIAGLLRASPVGKWQTAIVPLRCFVRRNVDMTKLDQPFNLVAEGSLTLSISDVRIDGAAVDQDRCGAP